MAAKTWTTADVFAGRGGARTDEGGTMSGNLTLRTTWDGARADVAVRYTGTSQWYVLAGSPVPCPDEAESRDLHQAVVDAVRAGDGAEVPRHVRVGPPMRTR
ncbi:hypothetical protein [Streptomyces asoensis]|uniref:Uncharacterized protein n=1 Tax=Streptomyces asoensis TaxID=249586 RepID=A0ABQ3S5C7_9ACTN|nr:hypothetical protein [Streptomyces asoensis]GGQ64614.1 hypothetical protein GCM10010496_29930 [Streptomyces asoensis]GHI63325.1 hypothetical protein Saso_49750 [Streptomyces asoensis]